MWNKYDICTKYKKLLVSVRLFFLFLVHQLINFCEWRLFTVDHWSLGFISSFCKWSNVSGLDVALDVVRNKKLRVFGYGFGCTNLPDEIPVVASLLIVDSTSMVRIF